MGDFAGSTEKVEPGDFNNQSTPTIGKTDVYVANNLKVMDEKSTGKKRNPYEYYTRHIAIWSGEEETNKYVSETVG